VTPLQDYIKAELNCKELALSAKVDEFVQLKAEPDRRTLGKRLGKKLKEVATYLQGLTHAQVAALQAEGSVLVPAEGGAETVSLAEVVISSEFTGDSKELEAQSKGNLMLVLIKTLTAECRREGQAREIMSKVQQLRKKAGLNSEEKVSAWFEGGSELTAVITAEATGIQEALRMPLLALATAPKGLKEIARDVTTVGTMEVTLVLTSPVGKK
jgi:isoleucyl-tRNA synthetase